MRCDKDYYRPRYKHLYLELLGCDYSVIGGEKGDGAMQLQSNFPVAGPFIGALSIATDD
jgi:hypothetical protein